MGNQNFDARKFIDYLTGLIATRGLTRRKAALLAGMNPGAISNYIRYLRRPNRDSCLRLAEALGVHPNEFLIVAGYEPLPVVDRALIDPDEFPPDIKVFAVRLSTLPIERRRTVISAIEMLLQPELSTVIGRPD